ncbi:MAG: translation initiation factor IF-6 [archaeon]|nr:translation initiation factor IF-6 [archaeon]
MFIKCNDKFLLIPKGLAGTKASRLSSFLGVEPVRVSISGLRLIGPLLAMNNKGIIVSRLTEDEEISEIKKEIGLPVERLPTKYTSIGNLVVANDNGAIVSEILSNQVVKIIADALDVQVETMSIASYYQVGSMAVATNLGVVVHPRASEAEVKRIYDILKADVEPSTVNNGVPYVASGIVANSKNAVVGSITNGPELLILSRILKV